MKTDSRTKEQIREHYEVERELAKKLREASRPERAHLASSLYDELYRRVPLHPQHTKKNEGNSSRALNIQMDFLRPFLKGCKKFLEVGPGDCALSLEISKTVDIVYAVDVSSEITRINQYPRNFIFLLTDGCSIPIENNTVDIAYSNQLMEHLHPDDAIEQLSNIYKKLVIGGRYLCITPNRLTGPHDVSKYFDEEATGFHLMEYTLFELYNLFISVGFKKVNTYVGYRGFYVQIPAHILISLEKIILILPKRIRKPIARSVPLRLFLNMVRIVGIK